MKRFPTRWTRRGLLLLFLATLPRWASAQFVEISATIELTSYRSGVTNEEVKAKSRLISSVCIAGTNIWRIDDWVEGGLNKWFFDGTNVYESLQVVSPSSQEMQHNLERAGGPAIVPFERARSNLTINIWPSSDGHPLAYETVNMEWLAFCSGRYLGREGRLVPLASEDLRHTPDRYAYTDQTVVFSDDFGLPRSVDLFMSRERYLVSVEDFYKGWGVRYLKWMRLAVTNVTEGALTFHYEVTATTNFLGRTFPLRFEFFQKGRDFLQNEGWFKRGVGTLKSIREVGAPDGLFNPRMQQTVVDWRFRDEVSGADANIYTWTNQFMPQTEDPVLQDKFKVRIEQARRHNQDGK
ncbi:MAG TPA: hypothetical protein VL361_10360 [Candidatus Limnocylindrales bacterium]|nr:hypothetical protein [Candidatus Limnocylindrales bacterium]